MSKHLRDRSGRTLILCGFLAVVLGVAGCVPAAAPAPAPPPAPAPVATPRPAPAAATTPQPTPIERPTPVSVALQPRYGGKLIIASSDNAPSLDVQQEPSMNTYAITSPSYNRLVQYDTATGGTIVPDLAESWQISGDGKVYAFRIRQGVKFHNGDILTADDVVFNLERLITPPKGVNSTIAPILGPGLDKIEKADDYTVILRLKFPLAPTLSALATDPGAMYPKKVVESKGNMKNDVIGTGPFKLALYTPSVGAELVRNPDYFVKGRPYLDAVSVRIIADLSTRIAALRTGQIALTARGFAALSPMDMEVVKASVPTMQFYPSQTPLGPYIFMNVRRPPFSDVRVRKAMSLALDRQAAVKVVAEGQGQVGTILLIKGWGVPGDEILTWPGWRQPKEQDVAEANRLMAEAGYANGFDLEILSRTNRITLTASTFMTDQVRKIGIRAQVKVMEDALFWDSGRKAQHQAMVYTPNYSLPDPGRVISVFLTPGGSLNFAGNDGDNRMVALNEAQMRALAEETRREIIREAETYVLREQLVGIPIVWPYTFIAVAPQVRGFIPGISDYVHNGNLTEVMWLAP